MFPRLILAPESEVSEAEHPNPSSMPGPTLECRRQPLHQQHGGSVINLCIGEVHAQDLPAESKVCTKHALGVLVVCALP